MFIIKKLLSQFLYPLPAAVLLLIAGLALLLLTPKQKLGKSCCTIGLLILLGFSYGVISAPLTSHLEHAFTPLLTSQSAITPTALSAIRWIVVLGNHFTEAPHLPATSQLSLISLARTVEAIRLHRQLPHSKILLSGGGFNRDIGTTNGDIMAMTAHELGVEPKYIKVTPTALDTRDEARLFHTTLGQEPFILVTSASHMPRAMALFKQLGMQPLAAPADYDVKLARRGPLSFHDFFPRAHQLVRSTKAVHEYLGILWAKIRGYM